MIDHSTTPFFHYHLCVSSAERRSDHSEPRGL
jgi:hypothetical protein